MQKANDLMNVHQRSIRAAERVSSNGRLQGIKQEEPPTLAHTIQRWFSPEVLRVNERQVRGFVVPHWAAGVILAAVLSGMGFMYMQISSQRDMLIEMKTELRMAKERDAEYRSEFKTAIQVHKAYIDNMTNQLNTIRGMLTPQQMRALERNGYRTEN